MKLSLLDQSPSAKGRHKALPSVNHSPARAIATRWGITVNVCQNINTWNRDPVARHRSYELLAREFKL